MTLYLAVWDTNYGLQCCVVAALNAEDAKLFALSDGAWGDYLEVYPLNLIKSEGIVHSQSDHLQP